jgi:hypothetical protein
MAIDVSVFLFGAVWAISDCPTARKGDSQNEAQ